jgi:tetratricopeptide (TPR) repeat protein
MSERFPNSAWRYGVVALSIAAAIWLSYSGVKHAIAGKYAGSPDAEDWLRAAQIEPGNAANWYRLGRYRQLDFDHTDLPLAISFYRRAVQLNPRSPYYKLDLASALEMSGQNDEAEKYFRAAQEDFPISAEVSWKYGNFLLRQQRMPEAYKEIHRAAMESPKLIPTVVSRVWRGNSDVHALLDQVLPDTAAADWVALTYFSDEQEPSAALAVWSRLLAKKPTVVAPKLFALLDMLVKQERYDDAGVVWRQAMSLRGGPPPAQDGDSLLYDGGFEKKISGGGFGWQQVEVSGADFDFDADIKHSGERSARISFDGTQNLNYGHLYQQVLVTPGVHYHFRGYLRTDKISTDSGARFEIYDPKDQKSLDVLTSNEIGTQPWTLAEADFTPGPKTFLVVVHVFRAPSLRFDNKISGTVWADDLAVFPAGVKP